MKDYDKPIKPSPYEVAGPPIAEQKAPVRVPVPTVDKTSNLPFTQLKFKKRRFWDRHPGLVAAVLSVGFVATFYSRFIYDYWTYNPTPEEIEENKFIQELIEEKYWYLYPIKTYRKYQKRLLDEREINLQKQRDMMKKIA